MADFRIITDSTADLPADYLKEKNVGVFDLSYTICGETYGKDKNLSPEKFYSLMREGNISTTSQINPTIAEELLLEEINENKEILYLSFSSGLSGSYNSVRFAAEEIMSEHSDVKIKVIDTKCASLGEGLLVYKAVCLRDSGKSLDEVYDWVNDNLLHIVHLFTVDDLNHLFRGGRVSRSAALIGTVLNIKPVLHVDDEGHLVPLGRERGRKKALLALVDMMEEKEGAFKGKNDVVFISHGDCLEDAEFVRDEIKKRFGIESFTINYVGPTICAHSGPGTIALFFMGDER